MRASCLISILLGMMAHDAAAVIIVKNPLQVDFTQPEDANAKATWSSTNAGLSKEGLGWSGNPPRTSNLWIETRPLPLKLAWRPPASVGLRLQVDMSTTMIAQPDGKPQEPAIGCLYARYSGDAKHWSSWQPLPQEWIEKEEGKVIFHGQLMIPDKIREPYKKLLEEYAAYIATEKPFQTEQDQAAALRWILNKQPDYLQRQIPFIGYVQFLYEVQLTEGRRIRSFDIMVDYHMGYHLDPINRRIDAEEERKRWSEPWSYRAEGALEPVPPAKRSADATAKEE